MNRRLAWISMGVIDSELFTSCSDVLRDNIRLPVFFFSELNNYWGFPGSGKESTNLSIFLKEKDPKVVRYKFVGKTDV